MIKNGVKTAKVYNIDDLIKTNNRHITKIILIGIVGISIISTWPYWYYL